MTKLEKRPTPASSEKRVQSITDKINPNIITTLRTMGGVAAAAIFTQSKKLALDTAMLSSYILMAVADILDGKQARRLDNENKIGSTVEGESLDPLSDKVMVYSALSAIFSRLKKNKTSSLQNRSFLVSVLLNVILDAVSTIQRGSLKTQFPGKFPQLIYNQDHCTPSSSEITSSAAANYFGKSKTFAQLLSALVAALGIITKEKKHSTKAATSLLLVSLILNLLSLKQKNQQKIINKICLKVLHFMIAPFL